MALSLVALMYTKESGVIFLFSLLVFEFVYPSQGDRLSLPHLKVLGCIIIPVIIGAIHFLLLKHRFNWFFYPLHLDYFKETWPEFHRDLRYIWREIWIQGGRIYLSTLLVIAIVWRFGRKHYVTLTGLLIITFLGAITFYRLWPSPSIPVKVLCLVVLIAIYLGLVVQGLKRDEQIIGLGLTYVAAYTFFSAYNVFTVRYLLCIIPWFALFVSWGFHAIDFGKRATYVLIAVLLVTFTGHVHTKPKAGISDSYLNYIDGIKVQMGLVRFAEQNHLYSMSVHASLLEKVAMQNPRLGFLNSNKVFEQVDFKLDTTTQYAIFTNVAFEPTYYQMDSLGFNKVHRIEIGDAWGEVYRNERMKE